MNTDLMLALWSKYLAAVERRATLRVRISALRLADCRTSDDIDELDRLTGRHEESERAVTDALRAGVAQSIVLAGGA